MRSSHKVFEFYVSEKEKEREKIVKEMEQKVKVGKKKKRGRDLSGEKKILKNFLQKMFIISQK